jgi:hypothetical protein
MMRGSKTEGVHDRQLLPNRHSGSGTGARDPNLREQGVTPMVIDAMQRSYRLALEEHPRLASDDHFECFQLGYDGVWYAGGPWGFHPDC